MQSVVREQSLSLGKSNQPDMEIKPTALVSLVLCSVRLNWSIKFHVLKQKEAFFPGEKACAHFLCAQCIYYWRECIQYVHVVSYEGEVDWLGVRTPQNYIDDTQAWAQCTPWQHTHYSKVEQSTYKHSGFFGICGCKWHPTNPYHGQASEIPWTSHWCSAHHWQQYHSIGSAGHHVHCQSGRSLHDHYPSDCCPLSPWRWSCWVEERMIIYNCDKSVL